MSSIPERAAVLRTHLVMSYLHYSTLPTIYNTIHSIQALPSIQNSTVMNYSRNPPHVCQLLLNIMSALGNQWYESWWGSSTARHHVAIL